MKKQKILIITKEEISSWKSCQFITNNLLKSYNKAFPESEFQVFKVDDSLSYYQAYNHVKKIKEFNVDMIVWLDHRPCSSNFLKALNEIYSDTPHEIKPKFLVHLFGDFILDCRAWLDAEESINHYPVHFIVASDKQKKIVDKMFVTSKTLTSVLAFPVDEENYSINNYSKNREEIRNSLELKDELVLIYTGRISFQKNVEAVINIVSKLRTVIDKKIEIWIAGSWDDILLPYFGMRGMPGSYYSQFNSNLLDKSLTGVRFLGSLEADSLQKHYHAADAFVSFSTYNDEDYGMSVAEALMSGLPCVLSDWGGFTSFANYSKDVELVPVDSANSRMVINSQLAQAKLLKKILHILQYGSSHESIAQEAKEHLSVDSTAVKIKNIYAEINFYNEVKYSVLFYKLCSAFLANPAGPFKNNTQLYSEIYGDYAYNKL